MSAILKDDTWLWSKDAPAGRLFEAGAAHPGKGWGDEPPPVADKPANSVETTGEPGASVDEQITAALAEQAAQFDASYGDLLADRDLLAEENASLKAKVEEQAEAIAKFDPDGDGKPGGSAPKAK